MSLPLRQVQVRYVGDVQGVGFRYTVRGIADRLGVMGGVENLGDGSVRLIAEGLEPVLQQFLLQIQVSRLGPYISNEQIQWGKPEGLSGFYCR